MRPTHVRIRCLAVLLAAAAALVVVQPATADYVSLFKDLVPGYLSSYPYGITPVNGNLLFMTCEGCELWGPPAGVHRLWKSNGTVAGTVPLKTFAGWPQLDMFFPPDSMDPEERMWLGQILKYLPPFRQMVNVNGTYFFAANDGTNGVELWKTAGTTATTLMVKNISPGANPSMPMFITAFNNAAYFSACQFDGVSEPVCGLWKSNGTAATTTLVKRFDLPPVSLAAVGGVLYFGGCTGLYGEDPPQCGLWRSNGTAAGTTFVYGPDPFESDYYPPLPPLFLTGMNGKLYFSACWYDGYWEGDVCTVWSSNGTAGGTQPLFDPYEIQFAIPPSFLTGMNGMLYFHGCDFLPEEDMPEEVPCKLFVTDGFDYGPVSGPEFPPYYTEAEDMFEALQNFIYPLALGPSWMTVFDGSLYFSACGVEEDEEDGPYFEPCGLWRVETEGGEFYYARLVHYLWPDWWWAEPNEFPYWPAYDLTPLNGKLYFGAAPSGYVDKVQPLQMEDGETGVELMVYALPDLGTTPTSVLFPKTYVNYKVTKRVTITNKGKGPMQIFDIFLGYPTVKLAPPVFSISKDTCPKTYPSPFTNPPELAPGASCYVDIVFAPDTKTTTYTDALRIETNDPDFFDYYWPYYLDWDYYYEAVNVPLKGTSY